MVQLRSNSARDTDIAAFEALVSKYDTSKCKLKGKDRKAFMRESHSKFYEDFNKLASNSPCIMDILFNYIRNYIPLDETHLFLIESDSETESKKSILENLTGIEKAGIFDLIIYISWFIFSNYFHIFNSQSRNYKPHL